MGRLLAAPTSKSRFKQGVYTPVNPDKYLGDPTKIRYMSGWELEACRFFDNNPNIIAWNSEDVIIPYVKPTTGRVHRYVVDFLVQYVDRNGNTKIELLEVKPKKQTKRSRSKNPKTRLYEDIEFAINQAKWQAAAQYAAQRGWTFKVVTENDVFR